MARAGRTRARPSFTVERNDMMPASVSGLDRFLAEMEYPATTDDLVREAARDGLSEDVLAALVALPAERFDSSFDVRRTMSAGRELIAA